MSTFTHTIYLESPGVCLELDCLLEYIPANGDGWNEPRYEACCELLSAKLGEVDIYPSLSKKDVEEIEQQAFEEHGEQAAEDRAESAFEARQDRINQGDHL